MNIVFGALDSEGMRNAMHPPSEFPQESKAQGLPCSCSHIHLVSYVSSNSTSSLVILTDDVFKVHYISQYYISKVNFIWPGSETTGRCPPTCCRNCCQQTAEHPPLFLKRPGAPKENKLNLHNSLILFFWMRNGNALKKKKIDHYCWLMDWKKYEDSKKTQNYFCSCITVALIFLAPSAQHYTSATGIAVFNLLLM